MPDQAKLTRMVQNANCKTVCCCEVCSCLYLDRSPSNGCLDSLERFLGCVVLNGCLCCVQDASCTPCQQTASYVHCKHPARLRLRGTARRCLRPRALVGEHSTVRERTQLAVDKSGAEAGRQADVPTAPPLQRPRV